MNHEIIDLQSRVAFQEDAIHQLNLTVSQLQNQIDSLRRAVTELHQQLRNLSPAEGGGGDEIPPHY